MLVGGNGSGKTTFYNSFLKPSGIPFINADNIARQQFPEDPEGKSYEASALAATERDRQLAAGASFCFETVFSHPSKIDFIVKAKNSGYRVKLVYIHLEDPRLNVARVSVRVTQGGHSVPEDKIRSRIPRTMQQVASVVGLVDELLIFDNSSLLNPYELVAHLADGKVIYVKSAPPLWSTEMLRSEKKREAE